jgi:alpha-L-rhamnosidase
MILRDRFLLVMILPAALLKAAPTHLVDEAPVAISLVAPGLHLVDFGRAAFGNIRVHAPAGATNMITVYFGEAMASGRVDRQPGGTVRYNVAAARLQTAGIDRPRQGEGTNDHRPVRLGPGLVIAPRADKRNTWQPAKMDYRTWAKTPGAPQTPPPPAILTPAEWDVVLPFRWVEVEGWPGELRAENIVRQAAYARTWDDTAASFKSSDEMLNRIWEMCRHSIKATTFAGVYVDGDRERIPYEADAYLNQLSHYTTDFDVQMARDTYDHLMIHGTWPTEWASHMVFMAHADWWHTGDLNWLGQRYDALRSKLLLDRVGAEGLVRSAEENIAKGDIVDWPKGERDGFVFTEKNAVVNAFYLRALEMMVEMGRALGRTAEAAEYAERYRVGRESFQATFVDAATGLCRDGVGTAHASLHSNLFSSVFGLLPDPSAPKVRAWLATRGMDCSVYVAQYFMEALFHAGVGARAVELMQAPGDRSWRHMVESGTTISWEAWDLKYKPNQDWNHAWGAAPANLLPRFVLGVQPAVPGWVRARVKPQPSGLFSASGRVPTPRGSINVNWTDGDVFRLTLELPAGVTAEVHLPARAHGKGVRGDGRVIAARREGAAWVLAEPVAGTVVLEAF